MTERTNRLIAGNFGTSPASGPAYFTCKDTGEQLSTDIYATCARLNERDRRPGQWVVIEVGGKKTVDWKAQIASADWLREKGLGVGR